jgi:transcriptional regulator with XRE-family HTH domain
MDEPDEVPGASGNRVRDDVPELSRASGDLGPGDGPGVPGLPLLPGFREMALRRMSAERRRLVADLTAQRRSAGLSQTEVAARMGTSQSAVARLETGDADVRVSTLERYAAAIGSQVAWHAFPGRRRPGEDQPGPERAGQGHPRQAQPDLAQPGSLRAGSTQPGPPPPDLAQPGSPGAAPLQAELGQEHR